MSCPLPKPSGSPAPGPPRPDFRSIKDLSAVHRRRALESIARIEAAESQKKTSTELALREEYFIFLEATHAAYDLAEMLPVERIVASKRPFRRVEDLDRIREYLRKIGCLEANSPSERLTRAAGYISLNQAEEALEQIDAGLALDDEHVLLRCARGLVLMDLERLDEAHAEYSTARQFAPADALALGGLGRVIFAQGHAAQAIVPFQRALASNSQDADIWRDYAEALASDGDPGEAMAAIRRSLALKGDSKSAGLVLGGLLEALERPREAASVYRRLLSGLTGLGLHTDDDLNAPVPHESLAPQHRQPRRRSHRQHHTYFMLLAATLLGVLFGALMLH